MQGSLIQHLHYKAWNKKLNISKYHTRLSLYNDEEIIKSQVCLLFVLVDLSACNIICSKECHRLYISSKIQISILKKICAFYICFCNKLNFVYICLCSYDYYFQKNIVWCWINCVMPLEEFCMRDCIKVFSFI